MPPSVLARVRNPCLALREVHRQPAWREPTVRAKNMLVTLVTGTQRHE